MVKYPMSLIPIFSVFFYFLFSEHFYGRTIGKKIIKIIIVKSKNNNKITFINSFLRHLFDVIDIYLFVGVVILLLTKKKRLGDFIGGTKVIEDVDLLVRHSLPPPHTKQNHDKKVPKLEL